MPKINVKIKKDAPEPSWFKDYHEDQKRHMGALSEDFQDKVKVVAELALDIKKTVDSHTKILDSHTEMIGKIMVDIEIMKSDIQIIKSDVKKKVDYEEFTKLERRVGLLESRAGRR
ncbi:MAG: hypothetical protein HY481_02165 [Candidatus Vogelbacteria bacterium]|nr:hypothetical protein [Candidatus Vogelbacteria bacterium]